MQQVIGSAEAVRKNLLEVLRNEEEAVLEMLTLSQGLRDRAGRFDLETVEELIRQRATCVERIAALEQLRGQLLKVLGDPDDEVREFNHRIREALDHIVLLDQDLQSNLHKAQYRALNSVASASNYLNFNRMDATEPSPYSRVVDVKR